MCCLIFVTHLLHPSSSHFPIATKSKSKSEDKEKKSSSSATDNKPDSGSLSEPGAHQMLAVLGIALITMGEDIGSEMSLRTFNHLVIFFYACFSIRYSPVVSRTQIRSDTN